jgi:hypothetical protein
MKTKNPETPSVMIIFLEIRRIQRAMESDSASGTQIRFFVKKTTITKRHHTASSIYTSK